MAKEVLTGSESIRSPLLTDGFALANHGISAVAIDGLIEAYANFTDNYPDPELATMDAMITDVSDLDVLDRSQDTQSEWHKYRTNYPRPFKPGGYTNRSLQVAALVSSGRDVLPEGKKLSDDPKEYYHYHPEGLSFLFDTHHRFNWGSIPEEVVHLHARAGTVYDLARKSLLRTVAQLDEETNIMSRLTPEELDDASLRILFYHPSQGDVLAAEHSDKGLFTMQLAESHVGLRVRATPEADMRLLRRLEDKGIVFAGGGWDDIHPDSDIKGTRHDVIRVDELNQGRQLRGRNCVRWALILFINDKNIPLPDKSSRHFPSN